MGVAVGVTVGVRVAVPVGEAVQVGVDVRDGVGVRVKVGVLVGVRVGVCVAVEVRVGVAVCVPVGPGVGATTSTNRSIPPPSYDVLSPAQIMWLSRLPPSSSSFKPRSKTIVLPSGSGALSAKEVAGRDAHLDGPAIGHLSSCGLDGRIGLAVVGDAPVGVDRVLVGVGAGGVVVPCADEGQLDLVVVPDLRAIVVDGVVSHEDGNVQVGVRPQRAQLGAVVGARGRWAAGRIGSDIRGGVTVEQQRRPLPPIVEIAVDERRLARSKRVDGRLSHG